MDKCLYLIQVTNDYWYCDHLEGETEYPNCDGCPRFLSRRMFRELRAAQENKGGEL